MKKVIVITPATGSPELLDAVKSVREQTHACDHLVVIDGEKYAERTNKTLASDEAIEYGKNFFRCYLPFNTGGGGYYGHRVMAAFSHLIPDYDYALFLDQDNWYEPNHVESLVNICESRNIDWAYSLRKIYNKNKEYVAHDNCESLGKWPAWVDKNAFLVDTSSYCFKLQFIKTFGHIWDHGWGADRRFFTIIKDQVKHTNFDCSGEYTLNYRLGGNEGSVQPEFFIEGNKRTKEIYNGEYPWLKPTKSSGYITITV